MLAAIRAAIDEDPKAWKRARDNKPFSSEFAFVGDRLKTAPRDYSKDHPMIDDLRRTDFIALAPLAQSQVISDQVVSIMMDRIKKARPLMKFLCEAIDVPY